jgi:hypothetical protein
MDWRTLNMVAETANVKPTNRIVYNSSNIQIQTKKVQTATNIYAGRLVKTGTNDDDVIVGTEALGNIGWVGYEQTHKKDRPATVDTIYAQDAQVAIISGPGMKLVASIKSGSAGVKGIMLKGAAAGQLDVAGATDTAVAVAEETVTGAAGGAVLGGSDILVRSLI